MAQSPTTVANADLQRRITALDDSVGFGGDILVEFRKLGLLIQAPDDIGERVPLETTFRPETLNRIDALILSESNSHARGLLNSLKKASNFRETVRPFQTYIDYGKMGKRFSLGLRRLLAGNTYSTVLAALKTAREHRSGKGISQAAEWTPADIDKAEAIGGLEISIRPTAVGAEDLPGTRQDHTPARPGLGLDDDDDDDDDEMVGLPPGVSDDDDDASDVDAIPAAVEDEITEASIERGRQAPPHFNAFRDDGMLTPTPTKRSRSPPGTPDDTALLAPDDDDSSVHLDPATQEHRAKRRREADSSPLTNDATWSQDVDHSVIVSGEFAPLATNEAAIQCMVENAWLTSTAIEMVLRSLKPPTSDWLVVDPSHVDTESVASNAGKRLGGLRADPPPKFILVPLNHSSKHWSMGLVELETNDVHVYDPDMGQCWLAPSQRALQAYLSAVVEATRQWNFLPDSSRFRQYDSINCGLYCLVYALHRMYALPLPAQCEPLVWRRGLGVVLASVGESEAHVPPIQSLLLESSEGPTYSPLSTGIRVVDTTSALQAVGKFVFRDSNAARESLMRATSFTKNCDLILAVGQALCDDELRIMHEANSYTREASRRLVFLNRPPQPLMTEDELPRRRVVDALRARMEEDKTAIQQFEGHVRTSSAEALDTVRAAILRQLHAIDKERTLV